VPLKSDVEGAMGERLGCFRGENGPRSPLESLREKRAARRDLEKTGQLDLIGLSACLCSV
jgi:hypothetical protein